ncbi:hypothetical protein L1887_34819 [Cichorium endivia]|nr:hypothetical protein L1887_34819 [Cichorium endivia]
MESAKLQIVLHCGKDLSDVKHLTPMDPYAIVWIAGDGKESKHITPIAENGACNPEWEFSMDFYIVSMNPEYTLFFEIIHDGALFDRKIGEVQVPFSDLLATDAPRDKVSYQVTTPSGEKKGEIIVSHKFSELVMSSDEDDVDTDDDTSTSAGPPRKKTSGIAIEIAKQVVETVVSAGTEVATKLLLEAVDNFN